MAAYVVATIVHIVFVVAHEPFSFDAWNVAVDTDAKPITIGRFFDYWQYEYAHSNPRLGQPLTYLAYKVSGFAEVMTPVAFIALTLAIVTLGLGRFPRRNRDLALWAIVLGCCWFVLPQIGRNMFCRSYATNYIYTAAIQLWFLVPLRVPRTDAPTKQDLVSYGMAGALTGICNEHTGPTLIAFLLGYAWWLRRSNQSPWQPLAGAIGVAIGFCALLFAPGQDERYGGLAQKRGPVELILDRGVSGAFDIVRDYAIYAAPVLGLIVITYVLAARTQPRMNDGPRRIPALIAIALAAGVLIALTLCASPKLGSRFFIVPLALLFAGFIGLVDEVITSPRMLAPVIALAVAASAYAAAKTVPLFHTVGAQGEARMAALEATKPGTSFVATPWAQVDESWWFIGDDFRDAKKRELVARYFALTKVTMKRTKKRRQH